MKKPIYVIGHKNPDTDSIVSAIAYAEYKKAKGENAEAARIGSANSETEFLLERFGFVEPERLYTARSLLKEIEMDKAVVVSKNITMKKALDLALNSKNRSLIVADKEKHIEGVVSLDDLTYMWIKSEKEIKKIIKTIDIDNVVDTLNGKLITRGNGKLSGVLHFFSSINSSINEGSIVLSRNEKDKLENIIEKGAKLIIIITNSPISKKIIELAKKNNVSIVATKTSPTDITRLIYQIPTVEQVMMKKEKVEYFDANDSVQDVSKKIAKSRHRSYPVVNDDGKVIGALSRYHLFNYSKKKFILVDHNETKQTIDDINDAEVIEIVDHHRIGDFETDTPISITTMPVGSTSTIIAKKFIDEKITLNKNLAGILLGAIISDTMNFNSPTTTSVDIEMAKKLEKICGVSSKKLSAEMVEHADSLLSKRFIEIVYNDYKEFNIDGEKVGLAQAPCKSKEEFEALKNELQNYLNDSSKSGSYKLLAIMLTNPNGSGSYLLGAGDKRYILNDVYNIDAGNNFIKGLVSRKKQLLPAVIKEMQGK